MKTRASWEAPALLLAERNRPPQIETIALHAPGPDEVAVRLAASGICHTDVAAVRDARAVPMVLGHEGAGYIEAVGEHVRHVKEGDRVVINWQPKCSRCRACRSGRADFCDGIAGTAQPRLYWRGQPAAALLNAGTLCSKVVVPAAGVVLIPREVPFHVAAMLGCAVATGVGAALYTAKVAPDDTVVVIGVGAVGLNIVQGARLAHASVIVAVDLDPGRLELSRNLGATHVINPKNNAWTEQVRDLTAGRGADHVFEAVGNPQVMAQGIDALARGGALTLVGAASRDASLTFAPRRFMSQQQTIRGCIYGNIYPDRDLPLFAQWYLDGRLQIDALLGERIALAQAPEYFTASGNETRRDVRTVVEFF